MDSEKILTKTKTQIQNPTKGPIRPHCPYCGSENVYGISRVVGYFSKIENWNRSKKAELIDRQKGNYRV